MPQGLQAIFALVVLLPGFVSARIVRMISAKTQQTELERVIEALIFSFLIYVAYVGIFGAALPLEWSFSGLPAGALSYEFVPHFGRLLTLFVLALIFGFGWGYVKGHDLLLRFLRFCHFTERSSRESVWTDVFLTFGGSVQVGLGDGRAVVGWLRQYSEAGDERTLLLERARWVTEDGGSTDIPGDGLILLTEKSEIKFVMFLDEEDV